MLSKLKVVLALTMLFGFISAASAGYYDGRGYYHGYDRCCCGTHDPYSKFNTYTNRCPDYPQQAFPNPSA